LIYNFQITVPANTAITVPVEQDLKLTHGVVHKLDINFPPGCVGLVGIGIFNAIHQVWPTNPEEMFFADDETISFREHYELITDPYILTARLYNLDDTFEHTITVRIGILPVTILSPWLLPYSEQLQAVLGAY